MPSQIFISGIYAGFMIGLGATAKLCCENPYVGSLLFCLGLCTVVALSMCLFTGRVGEFLYHRKGGKAYFTSQLIIMFWGNLFGTALCALLVQYALPALPDQVYPLMTQHYSDDMLRTFVLAILCGVCMHVAVTFGEVCKEKTSMLGIFLAVPAFILCGFRHSIAESFYWLLSLFASEPLPFSFLSGLGYVFACALGNALGSIFSSLYPILLVYANEHSGGRK